MSRLLSTLLLAALLLCGGPARAQPGATVLYIASERLTDLALGYPHFPNVARLGFGSADKPWHAWFGGGVEMRPLVYLPGYKPGSKVDLRAPMLIGNRFDGKAWDNAYAALASFDSDGNGIVEGNELRDLYVWVDFDGDGTIDNRDDALRPASFYYIAFDLRAGARIRKGHAREARMLAFAVLVPYASRIHLLELAVDATFASRHQGQLAHVAPGGVTTSDRANPFNGRWRWKLSNAGDWKDATRPWQEEPGGQLTLVVDQDRIHGVVQFIGPHEDRINLPLRGTWREGRAQWTSISPLGLVRSEVRLESRFGHPVLRARSWSNRNGKLSEWTWEARHDGPLD